MNGNQSPDLGEIAFNDMVDLKKRLDTIEKRVSRVIGILERQAGSEVKVSCKGRR
jgi:tetrahydromethanopterin S-methyltransferase subunit G